MQVSAELLGRHLHVGRVGYSEAAADKKSMLFETGWAQEGMRTLSGSVPMDHWSKGTSTDFRQGRTVVYPDVRTEPSIADELEHYETIAARAVVAVPFVRNGTWRGSLYVNHPEPRPWTTLEVQLIEEVALRTAEAMERAQAEEEVRALAGRLSMAQLAGRMASWQWEIVTDILVWDGGSEWTFGRPPSEMTHVEMVFSYIHEDDRDKVREDIRPALNGTGDYESEFRVLWPDRTLHWIQAFGKTVRSSEGIPVSVVGINIDITERKLAEAALLQNEKLAAVGRLSASIAHEINNPLESVTNLLYLARTSQTMHDVQEYLGTAERELRRVSVISNQTLRFYKQSTAPREVVCSDLFESVLSIHHGRLLNSRVEVERRKRARRPIRCFEGEIRQVLNNLVGNAIDAMHPQGGRLLVRSREATNWHNVQKGVALTVADTGTGMSHQVLRKVFEAFYTTKGIGGTGLGLWVSKEIVDRHHGTLHVRSSQKEGNSGTVFILFLPFNAVNRA